VKPVFFMYSMSTGASSRYVRKRPRVPAGAELRRADAALLAHAGSHRGAARRSTKACGRDCPRIEREATRRRSRVVLQIVNDAAGLRAHLGLERERIELQHGSPAEGDFEFIDRAFADLGMKISQMPFSSASGGGGRPSR